MKADEKRCQDKVVLESMLASTAGDFRVNVSDGRQCSKDAGHKGPHRFLLCAKKLGRNISLNVSWD